MVLGGGGSRQPAYPQPPPSDNLSGTIGSILGGVLGGGGGQHQQPAYQPSGGYGSHGSTGSDLLSGIGSALFSSAMDGFTKGGKDVNKLFYCITRFC